MPLSRSVPVLAVVSSTAAIAWYLLRHRGRRADQVSAPPHQARDRAMFPAQPSLLLVALFRVPTILYRLRLGHLLGHRFLLLTHRGRRSERAYQTLLEVVHFDPKTRESVVVSGWGERADWYRNIKAHPPVEVRTGRGRYTPEWRELEPDEAYAVVTDYMQRLPSFARPLARRLRLIGGQSEAERREHAANLLLVAFRPAGAMNGSGVGGPRAA